MKVEVNKEVDGVGTQLYLITTTDSGRSDTELFLGNGHKDVLLQFFKRNKWDEKLVKEQFQNVSWVFDKDIDDDEEEFDEEELESIDDEEEYEGEGLESIDVELIGEVI